MLKIEIIPCLNDNYSYLLYEEKSKIVAIIDPSDFETCDKTISKRFRKLDLILNTHHHVDHTGGNEKLKNKYKSKILACDMDKDRIEGIDLHLKDEQIVKIGSTSFKVIFIPGHTSGHLAFYFQEEKMVFTGDTLFSLGCGKVFEGTHKQMLNSLRKLKNLPKDTKIYCGHEYTKNNLEFCLKYDSKNNFLKEKKNWIFKQLKSNLPTIPTTVEDEQKTNIFLRFDDPSIKKALKLNNATEQEIFSKLRDLKDSF